MSKRGRETGIDTGEEEVKKRKNATKDMDNDKHDKESDFSWATWQSLRVFRGPDWGDHEFEVPMNETADGVWVVEGPAEWEGKYYQYVVSISHLPHSAD